MSKQAPPLRRGWTTGACAAAAAKAAYAALVTGEFPDPVEVTLPRGERPSFALAVTRRDEASATAGIVKDAGDDPDVTHGALVCATVRAGAAGGGVSFRAGEGVGTVTRAGLPVAPGEPAINPVPRRMILLALSEVTDRPLAVTFSVPGGEAMAEETTNDRLGIIGGISILGTTGIVRPFSTASYRASVVQQIDVAAAQGETHAVLSTGHRSETLAMSLLPSIDPVCFVEVGDFTGIALRRIAAGGMTGCHLVAMAGKLTKLASGVMMTHFHRTDVDTDLLAEVAREAGAAPDLVAAATETATARHFAEVCIERGDIRPLQLLTERARASCLTHTKGKIDVSVWMSDFEGKQVLARAEA
jgi:cobalt-precorrin-5B (C1)-methyltransferase